MNIQTRLFYDKDAACTRDVNSTKALKWYTANTQQNRALEHANTRDVAVGTTLSRGMASRNTDKDCTNTELYGTAPYLFSRSGDNSQVDIESKLLHRQMDGMNSCDRKPLYSESCFGPSAPLMVEDERVGKSSRNDRIVYGSQKNLI